MVRRITSEHCRPSQSRGRCSVRPINFNINIRLVSVYRPQHNRQIQMNPEFWNLQFSGSSLVGGAVAQDVQSKVISVMAGMSLSARYANL